MRLRRSSDPRPIKPVKGEPEGQLYDLSVDIREQNNLFGERLGVVNRLSQLLKQYIQQGYRANRMRM